VFPGRVKQQFKGSERLAISFLPMRDCSLPGEGEKREREEREKMSQCETTD
jgi:hypothetical protein